MRDESQSQLQYSVVRSSNTFVFSFFFFVFVVSIYLLVSLKISYPSRIGNRIRLELG